MPIKLKIKVSDFKEALTFALNTVDTRANSDYGCIYLNAKKGRPPNTPSGLYTYSTNGHAAGFGKFTADVEASGETAINPQRVQALLERQDANAVVTFTQGENGHITLKVNGTRITVPVGGQVDLLRPDLTDLPFKSEPLFRIKSSSLKLLIDKTIPFLGGSGLATDQFGVALLRSTATGYETLTASGKGEIIARPTVQDENAPEEQVSVQLPTPILAALSKILRNSSEITSVYIRKMPDSDTSAKIFFKTRDEVKDVFYEASLSSRKLPGIDEILATQVKETSVTVDRASIMDCLARSTPFVGREDHIQFTTKTKVLHLTANDGQGDFEDRMAVDVDGLDKKLTFRRSYLVSVLRCVDDESVVMQIGKIGKGKPVMVVNSPLAPGAIYVVGAIG